MSDLGPTARAWLDAARDADEPQAIDQARIQAKLVAKLALGAATVVAASTAAKGAGAAASASAAVSGAATSTAGTVGVAGASSIATLGAASTTAGAVGTVGGVAGASSMATLGAAKVVLAVALAGAASSGGVALYKHRQATSEQARVASTPASSAHARSGPYGRGGTSGGSALAIDPVAVPLGEDAPPATEATSETEAPSAIPVFRAADTVVPPPASAKPSKRSVAAPAPTSVNAPKDEQEPTVEVSPQRVSVADEAAMLRRAQEAASAGDAARALAVLHEHEEHYPHGVLEQERRAQRVFVLCSAGEKERALHERARFLADFPRSPLAARVRAACENNKP